MDEPTINHYLTHEYLQPQPLDRYVQFDYKTYIKRLKDYMRELSQRFIWYRHCLAADREDCHAAAGKGVMLNTPPPTVVLRALAAQHYLPCTLPVRLHPVQSPSPT